METNLNQVTKTLKKYWRGKGTRLRLTTFGFGAVASGIAMMLFFESVLGMIAFGVATILCAILTCMMLSEIYYMDAVEESMKEANNGERFTKKKAKNAVRFAKTFAIIGGFITTYVGFWLINIIDPYASFVYGGTIVLSVIVIVAMTGWLPFLTIVIGKFILKRRPAKQPEKVEALVKEIYAAADGTTDETSEAQKGKGSRVKAIPVLQLATTMICMLAIVSVCKPLFPEREENEAEQIIADGSLSDDGVSVDAEDEAAESEEAWYNDPNSNGYGFEITEECLNAYLAYVQSEEARNSFREVQENKESFGYAGGPNDTEVSYFAIAGMERYEPFLILASTNEVTVSDEVAFYFYSGPKENKVYYNGSFEYDYDMLSMSQTLLVNDLYVYCVEKKGKPKFYEETELIDHDTADEGEYHTNYDWTYRYQEGMYLGERQWDGKEMCVASALVKRHEIARVKWFSINDTDAARAYFSQFIKDESELGYQSQEQRQECYATTILQYMPYIDEGYFEIAEFAEGRVEYRFKGLSSSTAISSFEPIEQSVAEFDAGSASGTDHRVNIFAVGDGTYRALERIMYQEEEESGIYMICVIEIFGEDKIVEMYNRYAWSGEEATSIADIIRMEKH